jgi:Zn-dependent peptidase ImmA (M78 family)
MKNLTKNELIQRAIGISKDNYIDIIKLAENLGIDVYAEEKDDDFNSCIIFDKENQKHAIYVNLNHPITRQRFSIAHELAHYVLHPEKIKQGMVNREEKITPRTKVQEEEADSLAEEILMPKELIEKYLQGSHIDKTTRIDANLVNEISDYFRVSKVVATIRLRNLNFYVPFISFS